MLKHLSIRNFALIDELEIHFEGGLNILTGETGSGKSIIIEALELLLGERAEVRALRNKEEKCVIEGEFHISSYGLKSFFDVHEIDYADATLFRREINPQGKSRSFINDTPVNLSVMKELGGILVDVHSQHQTLDIAKSVNQFAFLDAYAGIEKDIETYGIAFRSWKKMEQELEDCRKEEIQAGKDHDYFSFQCKELEDAQLKAGELTLAEEELKTLSHADEIGTALERAGGAFADEQSGILRGIREVRSILNKVAPFHAELESLIQRLDSAQEEMKDIESELERMASRLQTDPQKLVLLQERVNLIHALLFKHRVKTEDELLSIRDSLSEKIAAYASLDVRIAELQTKANAQEELLRKMAEKISIKRNKSASELEKEITLVLHELAMPHAQFFVELKPSGLHAQGADQISFMVSTNKGSEKAELTKVASGGEFSRIMLALKSVNAKVKTLPTIIFDEIDTGVSGEVAHKMGSIMKRMGKSMQVFAITHLPQVAGKGDAHYKVKKDTRKNATYTTIIHLNPQQRLEEVARMLSGDTLSDAALANAKELIQ
jgi:DNA repair protein RecN (Recombination protein N)